MLDPSELFATLDNIDKGLAPRPHPGDRDSHRIRLSGPVVVMVNREGAERVLNGSPGMTFLVDSFTRSGDGVTWVAHVRDYRGQYKGFNSKPYQVWSVPQRGYEVVAWI
jgi:hypothetical protein